LTTNKPALWSHPWTWWLVLALAAGLALSIYLLTSSQQEGPGFPLDDAWIHQTYARNLAHWGEWAYVPGEPSAGSTAPLWSLLLAFGYWLNLSLYAWAYLLGGLGLFATAVLGEILFRRLVPGAHGPVPWVGLFLAAEWHLVWAAGSGMETVLYAALVLGVLGLLPATQGRGWGWLGLLIGAGVWVRPDSITLLGPALLVLFFGGRTWRERISGSLWLGGGFILLFLPYLVFNLQVQGSLWPNTFYAKQAEYAEMRAAPLLGRYAAQLMLPLVGGGLFLLPGFVFWVWEAARCRNWAGLGAAVWFLGFAAVYAERLPVTYQYGRYLIPAMPVYFVLGAAGLALILARWKGKWAWVLSRAWLFSLVGVELAFFALVAGFYARDVAIIETEMVATAQWLADHTEPDALLAVHDIGAVGYFSERRLVDLAGLVSPEVIPIIRDEEALEAWLDEQDVDYLVTLTGWYIHLPEGRSVVYRSEGEAARKAGGENMWVYRWKK
jgi:hypothetical protein